MVSAINRKLLRDIRYLKGQVITICLVVTAGITVFVAVQSTYASIHTSKDAYYGAYHFADVFATAQRIPNSVQQRLRTIPDVALSYPHIAQQGRLLLTGDMHAADAHFLSLPDYGTPPLNDVHLVEGRMPNANRGDEALVLEAFARAHGLRPGDTLSAVIDGTLRYLSITGLAMSPEYVFAMQGFALSYDPKAFAVLWMRRVALAPLADMEGAFNQLALRLQPGASLNATITAVDNILAPYGGVGAIARTKQSSHHYLMLELSQLGRMATAIPSVLLAVAAFLLNIVLSRLVNLQRGQIATLKALGYSSLSVGLHFLKLVCLIVFTGAGFGALLGSWLGTLMVEMYAPFFRFPALAYQVDVAILLIAFAISFLSAAAGAFLAVRRTITLPPAEAMRPPVPLAYKQTFAFLQRFFGPLGRMVLRDFRRRPFRLLISTMGIACAIAIMLLGRSFSDSMEYLMEVHFNKAMRETVTVGLREAIPAPLTNAFRQLPGVLRVEGLRIVPVRMRAGTVTRETTLQGLANDAQLRRVLNRKGAVVPLPLDGVLLTDVLAQRLQLHPGTAVDVELLEGSRQTKRLRVTGLVSDMLGMQGYMRRPALHAFLGEEPLVSMLLLTVQSDALREVEVRLQNMPNVAAIARPEKARQDFAQQTAGALTVMEAILALFASIIAIGIVYNNARVTLSMKSRELGSMRVLGFTSGETSTVLLSELAVQVALALPLGMWLGTMWSQALMAVDPENFRLPQALSIQTYLFAAAITIAAALVSALLVRRELRRLNIITVLKTWE